MQVNQPPIEEVRESILRELDAIERHQRRFGQPGEGGEKRCPDPGTPRDSM